MDKTVSERYEYISKIGEGGNGNVSLVYDKKLEVNWAMKEVMMQSGQELEALRKISHPSFPRIVDCFFDKDKTYLIMDYICGITLREFVLNHYISQEQVCDFALQLAEAFSYLHNLTPPVYYMDCKPQNIMVTEDGKIKIVDLGSVYFDKTEGENQRISGTPFYSSIEQMGCKGEKSYLSGQCDIYSLGMTLFYMMTKKEQELRDARGRLLVKNFNPIVSGGLNYIVDKCTRVDRKQRYQTMDELIADINRMEQITGIEKIKARIRCVFRVFEEIILSVAILQAAKLTYQTGNGIYIFFLFLFSCVLIKKCCKKKKEYWEVKKEIWKGSGKHVLYILLGVLLLTFKTDSVAEQQGEKLPVLIQDKENRNILIRNGTVWETAEDIRLKIPLEELKEGENTIVVICYQNKTGEQREYQFTCKKETNGH